MDKKKVIELIKKVYPTGIEVPISFRMKMMLESVLMKLSRNSPSLTEFIHPLKDCTIIHWRPIEKLEE